jgi:PAS domain S-box-containing protein
MSQIEERTLRTSIILFLFMIMLAIIVVQGTVFVENQNKRKEAEKARELAERLREEERFRAELIIVSSPYAILMCNDNQEIIVSNAAAEELFGWSHKEMVGMPVATLVPESFREKHFIASKEAGDKIRGAKDNWIVSKIMETEGLHRDGTVFPIVLNIRVIKYGEPPNSEVEYIAAIRRSGPVVPRTDVLPLPPVEERIQKSRMEMKKAILESKEQ